MFSIVIPLYNKERQIEYSIRSILSQTFQNFEIIVVNDGSTDNSVSVAESVLDPRIKIINQANAGVSVARNRGIKEARYDLIAFMDADDEWKPDYLDTQYRLTQKYPECSVFACNYEFKTPDGSISHTIIKKLPFIGIDGILSNYFEVACCSQPPLWTSAVMVKKSAIKEIGGFPINVTLGEDLITWAKLACKFQIAYSKSSVAIYNFRSQKQLVTPRRPPDKIDIVGKELDILYQEYANSQLALNEYMALWHKMRMVTFVKLNMKAEANLEYEKIEKYIKPNRKYVLWHILNYLPHTIIRFILFLIAYLR